MFWTVFWGVLGFFAALVALYVGAGFVYGVGLGLKNVWQEKKWREKG